MGNEVNAAISAALPLIESLFALGVPGIRAGSLVHIKIDAIELSRKLLIEKAVHKYKNCDHTMELRARVV